MLVWGVQRQSQIGAMSLYVTSVYGGNIGIVEKKMEATVVSIGVI